MIEVYFMIFCTFIIAFVIFAVIEKVLFGEWYTIYNVRYEHMRNIMRMWIGDILSEKQFEILELVDENDGEISYLVSDGKILIEVHDKKECAIKLKEILDNEW